MKTSRKEDWIVVLGVIIVALGVAIGLVLWKKSQGRTTLGSLEHSVEQCVPQSITVPAHWTYGRV